MKTSDIREMAQWTEALPPSPTTFNLRTHMVEKTELFLSFSLHTHMVAHMCICTYMHMHMLDRVCRFIHVQSINP